MGSGQWDVSWRGNKSVLCILTKVTWPKVLVYCRGWWGWWWLDRSTSVVVLTVRALLYILFHSPCPRASVVFVYLREH